MSNSFLAPDLFKPALQAWPFTGLGVQAYDLIMADPPWRFETYSVAGEDRSPQAHYQTMTLDEIADLPVADLAAPDCLLWLWATAPLLPQQIRIAEHWGFRFKTEGVWVKRTSRGKVAFGTGYVLRNAHEPFVLCTRGEPKTARTVRSVVMGPVREHSRKPDEAYTAAERLMPDAVRADLFACQRRPGWDGWGNQLDKHQHGRVRDRRGRAALKRIVTPSAEQQEALF